MFENDKDLFDFLDSLGFEYEVNSLNPGIVSSSGEYIHFDDLQLPSEYFKSLEEPGDFLVAEFELSLDKDKIDISRTYIGESADIDFNKAYFVDQPFDKSVFENRSHLSKERPVHRYRKEKYMFNNLAIKNKEVAA